MMLLLARMLFGPQEVLNLGPRASPDPSTRRRKGCFAMPENDTSEAPPSSPTTSSRSIRAAAADPVSRPRRSRLEVPAAACSACSARTAPASPQRGPHDPARRQRLAFVADAMFATDAGTVHAAIGYVAGRRRRSAAHRAWRTSRSPRVRGSAATPPRRAAACSTSSVWPTPRCGAPWAPSRRHAPAAWRRAGGPGPPAGAHALPRRATTGLDPERRHDVGRDSAAAGEKAPGEVACSRTASGRGRPPGRRATW